MGIKTLRCTFEECTSRLRVAICTFARRLLLYIHPKHHLSGVYWVLAHMLCDLWGRPIRKASFACRPHIRLAHALLEGTWYRRRVYASPHGVVMSNMLTSCFATKIMKLNLSCCTPMLKILRYLKYLQQHTYCCSAAVVQQ